MKIKDIKEMKQALTHAGKFHADDVFAAAFLKIINPDIRIIRSNNYMEFDGLIFDIGFGKYDHHMADNEKRSNGLPYASFGKLWREFAPELYGNFVCEKVDKELIQDLDLSDNTGSYNALAFAISVFNPEDVTKNDKEFMEALTFAKEILLRLVEKIKRNEKDLAEVKLALEEAVDKRVVVLEKSLYYKEVLVNSDAIYVVYPSNRGGFAAQGVPKSLDTVELKKPFPEEWVKKLPPYLKFCHTSRFFITADSFEDIMHAISEALK